MLKPNYLLVYFSINLLVILNLCASKPTSPADNSADNSISSEDEDYRRNYAKQIMSYMNRTVDPCDDFYEYACGNFKNVIEERQGTNKRSNILDINYKLADIVENILEKSNINDVAPEYAAQFDLAKKFYNNCLETELYPMQASQVYLTLLKEIGGFPAVDAEWNAEKFHWLNMSAHLSNYRIENFVNEEIIPEYPFPPYFKIPDFGFEIEINYDTIENTSSNAYKENEKTMRDILTIYGVEEKRIDAVVTDIFDFLKKLLMVKKNFSGDPTECSFLSELMDDSVVLAFREQWKIYNDIAWLGETFSNFSEVIEECCMPCTYMYSKIDSISREHKEAAANYLSLKLLYHLDAKLKDAKFQKEYCTLSIKSSLRFLFDHLYMKLYFSDELREEVIVVIKEIRKSLRAILEEASWLDESTREAALLKESKMGEVIGRFEDKNVTRQIIDLIKGLKFKDGNYDINHLNLRKYAQYMRRFNGLNFGKTSEDSRPLDLLVGMQVNAFYYNPDNAIFVMAGSLLPPVYHKSWPNSLKYGTLGYLIGHEFTHGFDTVGAQYDHEGTNNYWWSDKSAKVFQERADCYVEHYKGYYVPEIKRYIDGNTTKDENIADSGGLREALLAYRRFVKNATKELDSITALYKEEQMPGLDLMPEQIFFLGFSQLWCSAYEEAHYWEEITNEHTIDKFRVLGALSNNDDFAKAYNCPLGSKMNPTAEICRVW